MQTGEFKSLFIKQPAGAFSGKMMNSVERSRIGIQNLLKWMRSKKSGIIPTVY